jgi:hypothetical protein
VQFPLQARLAFVVLATRAGLVPRAGQEAHQGGCGALIRRIILHHGPERAKLTARANYPYRCRLKVAQGVPCSSQKVACSRFHGACLAQGVRCGAVSRSARADSSQSRHAPCSTRAATAATRPCLSAYLAPYVALGDTLALSRPGGAGDKATLWQPCST